MRLTHEQWLEVNAQAAKLAAMVQQTERMLATASRYPAQWTDAYYQEPEPWMNFTVLPHMPYAVERREYVLGFMTEAHRVSRVSLIVNVHADGSLTTDRWKVMPTGTTDLSPMKETFNEECPVCQEGKTHTTFRCTPPRVPRFT